MSYCINPNCLNPQNSGTALFCQACGSELLLEGCYRVVKPLGGGGFGRTFEVSDRHRTKVLKVLLNNHPKSVELFRQEASVLERLMQKVAGQQVTGIISPGYTPPEQMNGKAVPQSDFFALGRTFVYLLTGRSPNEFAENSRTGELIWRDSANKVSNKFADFINYLMQPFPGNRPKDTQEILEKVAKFDKSLPVKQNNQNGQIAQSLAYVGLFRRFFAILIDLIVVTPLMYFANAIFSDYILPVDFMGGFFIFFATIWLYFTLSESSAKKATIGKRILGIAVTDLKGNQISFFRANGRFFGKMFFAFLSFNYYGVGLIDFVFPCFSKNKRSLHDLIARTVVVLKRSLSN